MRDLKLNLVTLGILLLAAAGYLSVSFFSDQLRPAIFDIYMSGADHRGDHESDYHDDDDDDDAANALPVYAVVIDEESLDRSGGWPWSDQRIGDLINTVQSGNPSTVVLNLLLREETAIAEISAPSRFFDRMSEKGQNLVVGAKLTTGIAAATGKPLPPLEARVEVDPPEVLDRIPRFDGVIAGRATGFAFARGFGALNIAPDRDGIVRRVPMFLKYNDRIVPGMAAEAIRLVENTDSYQLSPDRMSLRSALDEVRIGERTFALGKDADLWFHARAMPESRKISAWKILEGVVDPDTLNQAVVVIGTTLVDLDDQLRTPSGDYITRTEVLGDAIEHMLWDDYLVRPAWADWFEIVFGLIAGAVFLYLLSRVGPIIGAGIGAVLTLGAVYAAYLMFDSFEVLIDPAFPVIAMMIAHLSTTLVQYARTDREVAARKSAEYRLLASESAAQSARRQAELANRAKSEFVSTMSHELRSPLNAIIGFAEILKDPNAESWSPAERASYANYIFESGNHLLKIINDILDLSKIEAGKAELLLDEVDVAGSISAAMILVQHKADNEKIALDSACDDDARVIIADGRAIKQMLINLLSNAVKFTQSGGSVSVRSRMRDENWHEISVSDTGVGVSSADLELIFEPFGQAEGGLSREHGGTGLGLPIVQSLAELHGGWVEVDSTPGEGSTFKVVLPKRNADEAQALSTVAPPPPLAKRRGTRVSQTETSVSTRGAEHGGGVKPTRKNPKKGGGPVQAESVRTATSRD